MFTEISAVRLTAGRPTDAEDVAFREVFTCGPCAKGSFVHPDPPTDLLTASSFRSGRRIVEAACTLGYPQAPDGRRMCLIQVLPSPRSRTAREQMVRKALIALGLFMAHVADDDLREACCAISADDPSSLAAAAALDAREASDIHVHPVLGGFPSCHHGRRWIIRVLGAASTRNAARTVLGAASQMAVSGERMEPFLRSIHPTWPKLVGFHRELLFELADRKDEGSLDLTPEFTQRAAG